MNNLGYAYARASRPAAALAAREAFERGLSVLESRLEDGRAFLAGERVSIADCTRGAGLQFARYGKVVLPEERWPRLMAWDQRFRARPAAKQVLVL